MIKPQQNIFLFIIINPAYSKRDIFGIELSGIHIIIIALYIIFYINYAFQIMYKNTLSI